MLRLRLKVRTKDSPELSALRQLLGVPRVTAVAPASSGMRPIQFVASSLGIAVAIIALPFVLLAGGPIEGWYLGLALWLANWGLGLATGKFAVDIEPMFAVGLAGISFIARAWIVVGVLFVVALRFSEPIALTAAAVFIFAFTFDLLGRTVMFGISQKIRKAEAGE